LHSCPQFRNLFALSLDFKGYFVQVLSVATFLYPVAIGLILALSIPKANAQTYEYVNLATDDGSIFVPGAASIRNKGYLNQQYILPLNTEAVIYRVQTQRSANQKVELKLLQALLQFAPGGGKFSDAIDALHTEIPPENVQHTVSVYNCYTQESSYAHVHKNTTDIARTQQVSRGQRVWCLQLKNRQLTGGLHYWVEVVAWVRQPDNAAYEQQLAKTWSQKSIAGQKLGRRIDPDNYCTCMANEITGRWQTLEGYLHALWDEEPAAVALPKNCQKQVKRRPQSWYGSKG
jgi:hypothetical protein